MQNTVFVVDVSSSLGADGYGCRFASKSAAIAIYTLGGFSLLGTLGVDTKPLVAGLGVGGFTVGFALRVSTSKSAFLPPAHLPALLKISGYISSECICCKPSGVGDLRVCKHTCLRQVELISAQWLALASWAQVWYPEAKCSHTMYP